MSRRRVNARATVIADPFLRPFQVIEIKMQTEQNDVHYLSGNYLITDVRHVMSRGEFFSELTLISDGHRLDDERNPGTDPKSKVVDPPPQNREGTKKTATALPERGR